MNKIKQLQCQTTPNEQTVHIYRHTAQMTPHEFLVTTEKLSRWGRSLPTSSCRRERRSRGL